MAAIDTDCTTERAIETVEARTSVRVIDTARTLQLEPLTLHFRKSFCHYMGTALQPGHQAILD